MSDIPAQQRQITDKMDSLTQIQTYIDAISKAQNIQDQIKQLQNIANFQNDPAHAVQQVNQSVTSMIHSFNDMNNTSFNNVSQLINALSGSASATSMAIKMSQAANMQLMGVQQVLSQLKVQQNALIAYKQAEEAQKQSEADAFQRSIDKSVQYNKANPSW